jgi:flagellar basal-body rod protein FlgB
MIARLTAGLEFHTQALVLRAERQRVIASNIANAETPGYQARDIDFAAAMRSATAGAAAAPGGSGGSAGAWLGRDIARDVMARRADGTVAPQLRWATPAQTNLDNNTVDMDRERASFMDNAVKYESTLRFINGSVRSLMDAMKHPSHG